MSAFHQGLNEGGFQERRNISVEFYSADDQPDRLPTLAAELVNRHPAAIFAVGGSLPPRVVKTLTSTIPIIFAAGFDPVSNGLVESLNRPGANLTGVSLFGSPLLPKRMEVLRELLPKADVIGVLVNPESPNGEPQAAEAQKASDALGIRAPILRARTAADLEPIFATFQAKPIAALVVSSTPLFVSQREKIIRLAEQYRMPAIYEYREFPQAGGLVSYGSLLSDGFRQAGLYAARILKGEKPADLPVMLSTKLELVINLKTAKTLGITVPVSLLGRADEVIE
jgi:putative ABC transport system substrate-binding protein